MTSRAGNTIPLGVLVVAALIAGGIFWWSWSTDRSLNNDNTPTNSTTNTLTNSVTNASTNTNATTNTATSATTTYTNNTYHISFTYPTGYVVKEYSSIFEVRLITSTDPDRNKPRSTDGMPGPGSIGLSRMDLLSSDLKAFAKTQTGLTATPTTTTLDGISAVHIDGSKTMNGGQVDVNAYFFNFGGKTWSLRMDLDGAAAGINADFTTVVNSLSFGRKKFTNTVYHYSFLYNQGSVVTNCSDSQAVLLDSTKSICETEHGHGILISAQPGSYTEASTITTMKKSIVSPTQSSVTVDDITATRLSGILVNDTINGGKWTDMVFITKGGKGYIITNVQSASSPALWQMDELIASFDFTN